MVVFGQKWLCLGKSGCIRTNWLFRAKWLYSVKKGCIWQKVDVFVQSGFKLAKWLHSGKSDCIRAKVVVFGHK